MTSVQYYNKSCYDKLTKIPQPPNCCLCSLSIIWTTVFPAALLFLQAGCLSTASLWPTEFLCLRKALFLGSDPEHDVPRPKPRLSECIIMQVLWSHSKVPAIVTKH